MQPCQGCAPRIAELQQRQEALETELHQLRGGSTDGAGLVYGETGTQVDGVATGMRGDVDELLEGMGSEMVQEAVAAAQDDDGMGPAAGGGHAQDLDIEALLDSVDCEVVREAGSRDDDGPPRVGTAASRGHEVDLGRMMAAMHLGGAMASELTSDEVASVTWFKATGGRVSHHTACRAPLKIISKTPPRMLLRC